MSWRIVLLEDEVVRHKTVAILDQFRQQVVSVIVCINLCLLCDEMQTSLATATNFRKGINANNVSVY